MRCDLRKPVECGAVAALQNIDEVRNELFVQSHTVAEDLESVLARIGIGGGRSVRLLRRLRFLRAGHFFQQRAGKSFFAEVFENGFVQLVSRACGAETDKIGNAQRLQRFLQLRGALYRRFAGKMQRFRRGQRSFAQCARIG